MLVFLQGDGTQTTLYWQLYLLPHFLRALSRKVAAPDSGSEWRSFPWCCSAALDLNIYENKKINRVEFINVMCSLSYLPPCMHSKGYFVVIAGEVFWNCDVGPLHGSFEAGFIGLKFELKSSLSLQKHSDVVEYIFNPSCIDKKGKTLPPHATSCMVQPSWRSICSSLLSPPSSSSTSCSQQPAPLSAAAPQSCSAACRVQLGLR